MDMCGASPATLRSSTFRAPALLAPLAAGATERGDVVGVYANTPGECDAFETHGFLLRQGRYTAIDFRDSIISGVFAIKDDGQMVGQYTDARGNAHGFRALPDNER